MIAILNSPILTSDGTFKMEAISLEGARELLNRHDFVSAIGHASTADILTELLEIDIPVNRITFIQEPKQMAIVFKMKSRVPEGVILNRNQIEEFGFEFKLLTREE